MRWEKIPAAELGEKLAKANGSLHVLGSFLHTLPIAGFVADRSGRILSLNPQAEKLLKTRTHEARGKTLLELGLDIDDEAQNRKVFQNNTAQFFFCLSNDPETKKIRAIRYSVLRFPYADSQGDRVIGGLVVPSSNGRD
jgi:PAS domain-containing protein